MREDQRFTPKYWVVHNKKDDDVIIRTLDKTRYGSLQKYKILYGMEIDDDNSDFEIILIEIREVNPKNHLRIDQHSVQR